MSVRFLDAILSAAVGVVTIALLEFFLGKTFDDIFTRVYWYAGGVFGFYLAIRNRRPVSGG